LLLNNKTHPYTDLQRSLRGGKVTFSDLNTAAQPSIHFRLVAKTALPEQKVTLSDLADQ
jgi:hypothetical protein